MIQKNGSLIEKKYMKDKVFIDTNVLIYAYSETEPDKKDTTLNILEKNRACQGQPPVFLKIFEY